ncbi:hypothetical protein Scep_010819 [Stephania cephalantha]|uniref:Origin recognition complex subunit 5 n=1 Tax=Stephania cephalantha TaxID=152367 RepID=A0AAP0JX45_9MAGN
MIETTSHSEAMSKEEALQVTKRTTRSSTSTPVKTPVRTQKTIKSHASLPSNNLVFEGEPLSLEALISNFPGRRLQILKLLNFIGPLNTSMLPLFLYGGPATGKTSVLLQSFRHLQRPFVYASCRTCHNPKILFESVLNQLLSHRQQASNGYSCAKKCEKPSDFVHLLQEALKEVINTLKGNSKEKMVPKESEGQDHKSMVYLIFDNLELVRDWEKHSVIISMLFKLYDILKLPEVGLIFISNASPDTYYMNTGSLEPLPIYFPDYTEDELYQIFSRNQENPKLYSSFLDITLKPFCRITRRVDELSIAFQSLFQKYCEPLSDSGIVPTGDMKRMLFKDLNRHLAPSLNETFSIPSHLSYEEEAKKDKVRWKANVKNSGHGEALDDINFHMSISAKYLLISAFLASRNRATLDATLFDSTGGGDNRKRKRKISEASKEKKETAEEELLMKGPGTFPLERLLAIFQCITSVMEDSLDEGVQESGSDLGAEGGNSELMSDVLLQLSTLCNANFISKGGTCPLEASTRYRSTVSEELALKVARSMKFPLSQYLYQK